VEVPGVEDEQLLQPEGLPRKVGSFELLEEIGRGGMGIVYRARDLKLEREVALKRPTADLLTRPGFRQRFFSEARSASKLMHPNIVTVFEVFEADDVPWMAMEHIDGASLRSMLSGRRSLPVHDALEYAEGLTDALRVAHLGNVLHRDVNPNNILIGRDGRARLTDFGLAEALGEIDAEDPYSERTTESRTPDRIAGTRGYMSPEQALGNTLDARSDIFSLGVVLYEMCTGEPAFAQHDSGNWLDALLNREPRNMAEIDPKIPAEVQTIVRKSIAKRPFQRYQSATEMLLDVSAARRRYDSDSGPISGDDDRTGLDAISKRVVFGAVALSAIALIVMIVALATRSNTPTVEWKPRQVTSSPGWEGQPAISPDGRTIAYVSDESGSLDIWAADVAGGGTLQLTTHLAVDHEPAWFPDGSAIAFVSDRSGTPAIWKVPRFGGDPVMLIEKAGQPAISPDGSQIAFVTPQRFCKLRVGVAPLENPTKVRVLTAENQGYWDHENPTWSPDGKMICFSDFRDLYLVPADGSETPVRLTTAHAKDRHPVWSGDGRWIFFSSAREGTTALWRVRSFGGEAQRLTLGTGPESEPSLTSDGHRVAYSTSSVDQGIALLARATGESTIISEDSVESSPVLAPDGSHVVFVSNRGGSYDLWKHELRGHEVLGPAARVTGLPGDVATPAYSRDGRWLAFFRVFEQQRDIWTLNQRGGLPNRVTEDPAFDIHPCFSPNGDRIAFVSQRGGNQGLWWIPVNEGQPTGEPVNINGPGTECAMFPRWSPRGDRLAWVSDNEAWTANVEYPAAARAATAGAMAMAVGWEPEGDRLLVSGTWGTDRVELRSVDLATGETTSLSPPVFFGKAEFFGLFDLTADGSIIAHMVSTRSGNIWVAELGDGP
jgi:Tol biopolymer transport system component